MDGSDLYTNFDDQPDGLLESIDDRLGSLRGRDHRVPLEGLINVDYSLNSPLISDEIDEFLLYIRGRPYRTSWNQKLWLHRKLALTHVGIKPDHIKPPSEFHSTFFKYLKCWKPLTHRLDKLLTQANKVHITTWEIPKAFFKTWLGKDLEPPEKSSLSPDTQKYGSIWLDLHFITLFLNASSKTELKELSQHLSATFKDMSAYSIIRVHLPNLGFCTITNGIVFISNLGILADRNMILMMKDVTNSRFQSLMCLQNRLDDKFSREDLHCMERIYRAGDELIIKNGNIGYDGVKLLEPLCNLRFTELAQLERPRIPLSPDFKTFLRTSIEESGVNREGLIVVSEIIDNVSRVNLLLVIYGSYRHWGHPFLEYLEGLRKLRIQTNMNKDIDSEYAGRLASDLAMTVCKDQFTKTKKWPVDVTALDKSHKLYDCISQGTWPTPFLIRDIGETWHLLPLKKCFEIPDVVDPSIIYSDKSHSLNRSEILAHVQRFPNKPIPSKKVLETFIKTPATDWKKFLQEVNDQGLDPEYLVIGLRGKEREIKRIGRFFALMSWKLRDYFVITEYLIKIHFVPLFSGLTMADDLNTVMKKMLDTSNGQGLDSYEFITLANHIDYEKWNNHQRGESNSPVFRVMGQFLGYPDLISRTHEFFEQSLIYYNGRPDLMCLANNTLHNKNPDIPVCWNGQRGGLEGLRQKGWSITNLLVIRREGRVENTRISILAQGDNQVICTQYKLQKVRTDDELDNCIQKVLKNNQRIMGNIIKGTERLGLIINQSETIRSADYLNYGKVPIFRGKIMGLESKRWSRVTCVSNDQLPSIGNIMSTVSSNALSVGYFSESPINAISHYNFIGNLTLEVLSIHNPATKCALEKKLAPREVKYYLSLHYRILLLYLDPSLGGICGVSLTRFLIRSFPDPLTEGLSFWKGIYPHLNRGLQGLIYKIGNPQLCPYSRTHFPKLLENPLALNLKHGVNPVQVIKDEIKKSLIRGCDKIQNHIVRHAVIHSRDEEQPLYAFLESITPRFPRFLSEYKASTYLGMTEGLVGLFQNSKTIRNMFSSSMKREIDNIIITSEIQGVRLLLGIVKAGLMQSGPCWPCSSEQADTLRTISWGGPVLGATIPHPFEMMRIPQLSTRCSHTSEGLSLSDVYLSVLVPKGMPNHQGKKGPYKAYLGSKTKESTSLLRPWENESKIPLIRRAADLRKAFGWFINQDSNLGRSILSNLSALTGENWEDNQPEKARSGSALHRFSCSRQSQGGYIAQAPLFGTWMLETTDTMSQLGSTNYDFLYQAQLLYSQMTIGEIHNGCQTTAMYHFHIDCIQCLRPIEEVKLDSDYIYIHPSVSDVLESWKPEGVAWLTKRTILKLPKGNWARLDRNEQSFHIGKMQGFLYGEMTYRHRHMQEDASLFPLVLREKLSPRHYMKGLLYGLIHASAIAALYRRSVQNLRRPDALLLGQVLFLIDNISCNSGLINVWRGQGFLGEFILIPHRIPPSYPLNNHDLGSLGRNYLRATFTEFKRNHGNLPRTYEDLWIFSDFIDSDLIIPYVIAKDSINLLYLNKVTPQIVPRIRELKELLGSDDPGEQSDAMSRILQLRRVYMLDQELRHALKSIGPLKSLEYYTRDLQEAGWGPEYIGDVIEIPIAYEVDPPGVTDLPLINHRQDPLISGLRLFQCPTGAHYKLRTIIERLKINFQDVLVGGDGSGGMTSCLLRMNPISRAIFNSLLDLEGVELKGSSPSPPSAIACIPEICRRCVNYQDVWKGPTDLCREGTWINFVNLQKLHELSIDLLVFDVETKREGDLLIIEQLLSKYVNQLLTKNGVIVFKTHVDRLLRTWDTGLMTLAGSCFRKVSIVVGTMSSSGTSEVYLVMRYPRAGSLNCKPAIRSLIRSIHIIPSQRSCFDEFRRALAIPIHKLFKGVPKSMIPDPHTELCVLLISIGVESGIGALVAELWRQSTYEQQTVLPYYTLFTVLNSLLQLTRGEKELTVSPDRVVYNVGGFLVGFLNWFAWITHCYRLKALAQSYIDHCFLFSWKRFKTKKNLIMKKISFLGAYTSEKNVYLDSKMALVGSVIRVFARLMGPPRYPQFNEMSIDHLIKAENIGNNLTFIRKTTDILDVLDPRTPLPKKAQPFIGVTLTKRPEVAWTQDQI
ncbi:RNA-dependent RNA polymerase [Pararge aegeria rhabdovirus]|uniref:Replicase n=3 Tax=root TaxID=1 RepID=A0A140D8Q3_9RHAB|nr:RNA-dependent RNA polymerase [Pararge aegeria rhabdovirus]AMK09277.1 RNA-dependent RNA polymerase [Pararge aegeria rhabdovirus]